MIILSLILGCSEATPVEAAPTPEPAPPAKTVAELASQLEQDPTAQMKLLFVVEASSGSITKTGDETHEFSFPVSALTAAIAFTDRPARRSFDVPPNVLAAMWDAGKDSFAASPPNAVLEDDSGRLAITELTGLVIDTESVTFTLDRNAYRSIDSDDALSHELTNPTLFIDSSLITAAGVAGLLRAGAQACAASECYLALLGA
tara:strand:- start:2091 stop:2699 length:609 start_codon:yes stop_codon:yes gene_type:complete